MAKQCLSRVPTATHWKWLPGSLYEKDDSGLGTKTAMMVLSLGAGYGGSWAYIHFFLSKLNLCVISIVTGEM